ncbi:MAG: LLM class F420-dependent oxidoreductase [Actinomycetota bacterium]|nr:LLM class F420-dependent oxidoreductase [Actinomycetota bacterium]
MRFGYFANVVNDGTIDDIVGSARTAETEGYDTYWAPQIFSHDTLTALAVVGREVPRIELGTSVVPTYPRHPLMLAQQCLTVVAATGGRLCLGIGLSHKMVIENMFGMSFEKPVRHMREYLQVLAPAAREGSVAHDGEVYQVHASIDVKGAQAFPILLAALGTQMLELAGDLADGTMTWMTGPATLRDHVVPTITKASEAAERPNPRIVAALPVCVTDDVDGARQRAATVFKIYGQLPSYRAMLDREGADGPADVAVIGSEDEVVERISGLSDLGVSDFAVVEFSAKGEDADRTRQAMRTLISPR